MGAMNRSGKAFPPHVPPSLVSFAIAIAIAPVGCSDTEGDPAAQEQGGASVFVPTAPPLNSDCADWGGTYDDHLRPGMVDALTELDRLIQLHGFDVNPQAVRQTHAMPQSD